MPGSIVDECADLGLFEACLKLPPMSMHVAGASVEVGEFLRAHQKPLWGLKGTVDALDVFRVGLFIESGGRVDFTNVDDYELIRSKQFLLAWQAWQAAQSGDTSAADRVADFGLYRFAPDSISRTAQVTNTTDVAFMMTRAGDEPELTLQSPGGRTITRDPQTWGDDIRFTETVTTTLDSNNNPVELTQWTSISSGTPRRATGRWCSTRRQPRSSSTW